MVKCSALILRKMQLKKVKQLKSGAKLVEFNVNAKSLY